MGDSHDKRILVQLFIIPFSDRTLNSCDFDRKIISFLFDVLYNYFDRVASINIARFSLLTVFRTRVPFENLNVMLFELQISFIHCSRSYILTYEYRNDHKCKILVKN